MFYDISVFREDYIPDNLLYREEEINKIGKFFAGLLKNPRHMWIFGEPSTGKSQCILKIAERFNEHSQINNKKTKYIYLTAREQTLPQFYNRMLLTLNPNKKNCSWNSQIALNTIIKEASNYKGICLIFDELDKIVPTSAHDNPINSLLGVFSRLHEQYPNFKTKVMIVAITNDIKIINTRCKTDTLSSFQSCNLLFPSYDVNQLYHIFKERVKLGLNKGVINYSYLKKLSANIKSASSDVRTGISIIREAGIIAEEEEKQKIEEIHIKKAMNRVEKNETKELLSKLDETQLCLLHAIASLQKKRPNKKPTSDILYPHYRRNAKEFGAPVLKKTYVLKTIISKLKDIGLIDTKLVSKGYGAGVYKSAVLAEGEEIEDIMQTTDDLLRR